MSITTLYCGIDISADSFDICMQQPEGEIASGTSCPMTQTDANN